MPVSGTKAPKLVWAFLRTIEVPKNCYILDRGINRRTNERCLDVQISVKLQDAQIPGQFRVLKLSIDESERVTILIDRREYIQGLLSRPGVSVLLCGQKYDEKRAREVFLGYALSDNTSIDWVLGIRESEEDEMRRGIDAWVSFVNLRGKTCRAPIKVCASQKEKANFFSRRTQHETGRIVSVILTPDKKKEDVMRDFYHLLENKRRNGSY